MMLPIHSHEEEIVKTVLYNKATIIVGQTGSGKTTQTPQFLYNAGLARNGLIGVTEPRKIAAISTAQFVAQELGVFVGEEVGYQVRFDDSSSSGTVIKFMTEGILLREFQIDPDLRKYSIIMVDEAHERSKNTDFVSGLLKNLLDRRNDLKVIIASATIDEEKYSRYFGGAPIINVSGKMFPVETVWSEKNIIDNREGFSEALADAVAIKVAEIHTQEGPGDILVFMTGQDDINRVIENIEDLKLQNIVCAPIYGALPWEEQQKIFQNNHGRRKVVVATNIAETSITIDGIVYVIDSGFVKQSNFHPESGIQSLDIAEHSQAGCDQRKGRAGRTQPGICFRMYTEDNFKKRPRFTQPEILRESLASVVLTMEDIGIKNIRNFDFIDSPKKEAWDEAYETLIALGAIERNKVGLTTTGGAMAQLPLEPRIARMLLEARKHNCVKNVATVAAFISARNVFYRDTKDPVKAREADAAHYKFKDYTSDALTSLKIWDGYESSGFSGAWCFENFLNAKTLREITQIRSQLLQILEQAGIELTEDQSTEKEPTAKSVAVGLAYNLFEHEARQWYVGVIRTGNAVAIHPSSSLFFGGTRWFVATQIRETTKVWALGCTEVKPEWLPDIVPNLCKLGEPILESYNQGDNFATVKREIVFKERVVGHSASKINLDEARKIQDKKIQEATRNKLLPVEFKKQAGAVSYLSNWIAEYRGEEYKASYSIFELKPKTTYYCLLEDRGYGKYATPVFEVFDFPQPAESESAKKSSPPAASINNLAERWGAKITKKAV